jgi:hypothetical protein
MREGRFRDYTDPQKSRKRSLLIFLELFCFLGFVLITLLVASNRLPVQAMLLGLLFALIGSVLAYLYYKEIVGRIK